MKANIIIYQCGQPRDHMFYSYIGPYALNRKVTSEIHDLQYGSIYDEPYAAWIIMTDKRDDLIGFCAIFEKEKEIFFDNFYIVENYRRQGFARELFRFRMNMAKSIANGKKIKGITQSEIQYRIYNDNGFKLASKRGKYYWMVLEG